MLFSWLPFGCVWLRIHNISLSLTLSLLFSLRFSNSVSAARLCLHLWIQSSFFSFGLRKFVLQCKSKSPVSPLTTYTGTPTHPQTPAHTLLLTKCMSLNKLWFIYTHFALCSLALGQSLSSHGKYSAAKQLLPTAFASVLEYLCVCRIFLLPCCNFALSSSFRTKLCIFVLEEANAPVHPFKCTYIRCILTHTYTHTHKQKATRTCTCTHSSHKTQTIYFQTIRK